MKKSRKVWLALAAAVVGAVIVFGASGCSQKAQEPYKDAPVGARDTSAAEVYDMPDGFGNFAEKCDRHGNRVVVVFHSNSPYGSVAITPDTACSHSG